MSTALFDDIFSITSTDAGKYAKVVRITAQSTAGPTKLTLDVNSELFPCQQGDAFTLALAKSLSLDGEDEQAAQSWRPQGRSLMDDYDYVMHGTVYKFQDQGAGENVQVYVSFGGLLLCLEGEYRTLAGLKQENLYLLMRR